MVPMDPFEPSDGKSLHAPAQRARGLSRGARREGPSARAPRGTAAVPAIAGGPAIELSGVPAEEWIDRWAGLLLEVEGRAPKTIEAARFCVERFFGDLPAGTAVEQLDRAQVEKHLRRLYIQGLGESARGKALHAIRSFCRYLVGHGRLERNPADEIRAPRVYTREKPTLSVAEIRKLIALDGKGEVARRPKKPKAGRMGRPPDPFVHLRNVVLLAVTYAAGLRASEVGPLRVEDLDWNEETSMFSILVARAKGARRDERIQLPQEISRLLGFYLGIRNEKGVQSPYLFPARFGIALQRRQVHRLFIERVAEVGIERKGRRLSPHTLRHSRATHLLEAGVDVRSVQRMLRHRSIQTTAGYLHTSEEKIARYLLRKEPLEAHRKKKQPQMHGAMRAFLAELGGGGLGAGPN